MITLLLLIPFIGSFIILLMNESMPIYTKKSEYFPSLTFLNISGLHFKKETENINLNTKMKQIALTTSLINFFLSLYLWSQFDSNLNDFQFVSEFYQ